MTSDWAEKNREVFEKMSKTYRRDFGDALKTLFNTVQERRGWVSDTWTDTEAGKGREIKILEYACGPGVVSIALAPFVNHVIGMDIAQGMVDEYNKNAREAGLADTMVGMKADLLAEPAPPEVSGPQFFDFDIVVVSGALHHFEKPERAMARLGERLKKGGVLFIIDMIPGGGAHGPVGDLAKSGGGAVHTISRNGFSEEDMQKLYEGAGVGIGFEYKIIEAPLVFKKDGKEVHMTWFTARGQRA